MSMSTLRIRFIALVVGTLVLLVGTYAAAYKPAKAKLSDVRADVQRSQAEVAELTSKLHALQELQKNEKTLREQVARFGHALPSDPAVSNFILDVQDAADQAGIDFLSVAPSLPTASQSVAAPAPSAAPGVASSETTPPASAPAPASSLQAISVSISATGKFFSIESFVAKLEKLPRALRIGNFTLAPGGGSTDAGALSLSIQLQIFSLGAPAAAPTTTAPSTTSASGA